MVQQAGTTAGILKSKRRRSGVGRYATWLPVIGLIGVAALMASGGGPASRPAMAPPKPLVNLTKLRPPPRIATAVPRHATLPQTGSAALGDAALVPVAQAVAPGIAGDGTIRVAATLIVPAPKMTRIAANRRPESPGTATAATSRNAGHNEQVASLTTLVQVVPAWRIYAQQSQGADQRPRIAIIVAGIDDNMGTAIAALPPAVTLALDPYARRLPEWIELARAKGHEVLLTLSAPSLARGRRDAGPMAILSSLDPKENLERLDWALGRAAGFVGVVDIVGNRAASETQPILGRLADHGMMLVSGTALAGTNPAVPFETADVVVSPNVSRRDMDQKLAALQDLAQRQGQAVGIVVATPSSLHHVAAWLGSLANQSITLVPTTAMIPPPPGTGIATK